MTAHHEITTDRSPLTVLRDALDTAFQRSQYLALRLLQVEVTEDVLTLKGKVPSFYLKQVAQTYAGQAMQSHRIDNQIEVAI